MAGEYTYLRPALLFIDPEIDRTENMKPCASLTGAHFAL